MATAAEITVKIQAASASNVVPVTVVVDRGAAERVEAAHDAVRIAERRVTAAAASDGLDGSKQQAAQTKLDEAAAELEQVRADAADATVTFVFRSMGRKAWRQLEREHPATEQSRREYGRLVSFDPETFCDAAIIASMVDPEGATADWWAQLCDGPDGLTNAQWSAVWAACNEANNGGVDVPKSLRSSSGTTATG